MKTVLLTGATGFLGSHLLEELLIKGFNVIVLKRSMSDTWRIEHLLDKTINYDLDTVSISNIFDENNIDLVIHLATLYRKFDDGSESDEMIKSNISFPVELVEQAVRNGVKGFINTGTYFEYDCSVLPISEKSTIKPYNLYAKTKIAFESMLKFYSDELNITTLRLFSPYGEKDNDKLIPMIIKKALSGDEIKLSEGLQKMDFIYSGDIVDAFMSVIEGMKNNKNGYAVFNIGSGYCFSVREVVSIVEQKLGKVINKKWGEPSTVDMPLVVSDISKAIKELGWAPKTNIHDGIEKCIKYYGSNFIK